ncbi:MAG TPA: arsenic transporter [Xanthobacteraceae bacterium]
MSIVADSAQVTWGIAALSAGGVIVRPWRLPEAIWAVFGAAALVVFGLLPWTDALIGVRKGLDVYLFLTGMMLLAELARQEGLFDWLAALAVEHARGSPQRLFVLVYAVGAAVTIFLSNDATAVVLTPAVYAAARAAGASPLPYLLVCAFIANAASFVLPISNPANLVIFDGRMPHLSAWLGQFGLPSVAAIGATYVMLRVTQHDALRRERIAHEVARAALGHGGRSAAAGIAATAVALLLCSAFDLQLGLPTFVCGGATTIIVLLANRQAPWPLLRHVSWGILPLVAGLFVLVEGLDRSGLIAMLNQLAGEAVRASSAGATWSAGIVIALACNLMNNLPAGLIAGSVMALDHVPPDLAGATLIGVDIGPNLSVTGSLATILWLVALRREGQDISAWRFLRLGVVVMPPALILAIGTLLVIGAR